MTYTTQTAELGRIEFFARGSYLFAYAQGHEFQPCEGGRVRGPTVQVRENDAESVKAAAQKWVRQRRQRA